MLKVELIYDSDCPNAEAAKQQLVSALREVGMKMILRNGIGQLQGVQHT